MIALGAIPSPSSNGFSIGPLFFHAYGIAYVFAVAAAIYISRWRWGAAGRRSGPRATRSRCGAFPAGLIGGRIYFDITTPEPDPAALVGRVRDLGRAASASGAASPAASLVGLWVAPPAAQPAPTCCRFMDVVAPGAAGRPGDRPDRQLLQPGAVRQADVAAVGAEDLARAPAAGLRAVRDLPADLPLRADLEPRAGRVRWSGWAPRAGSAPPGLFALYVAGYSAFRIFEETLRIDYSNHFLGLRLNFFVALALCLVGLLWFVAIQTRLARLGRRAGRGARRRRNGRRARRRGLGLPRAASGASRGTSAPVRVRGRVRGAGAGSGSAGRHLHRLGSGGDAAGGTAPC